MSQVLLQIFLVIAAFGAGVWLGERETRQKRGGWRPYHPERYPHYNKFQIMRDCK